MLNRRFDEVYALVRQIPYGKVATYGQIARWLGWEHGARTVGWALRLAPPDVPWHRVVNAQGAISLFESSEQRARLEVEGIRFDISGRIDLGVYSFAGFGGDRNLSC